MRSSYCVNNEKGKSYTAELYYKTTLKINSHKQKHTNAP